MKTYEDLQELTGHESGAIRYSDGAIWIGNWTQVQGIPRLLEPIGMIGLGETLTARRFPVPAEVKKAMQDHEWNQGAEAVSEKGFSAWLVNGDTVVVVQENWA